MGNRLADNSATRLTVAALLVAAIGILFQYISGVGDFPTIPPGPIILAVLAAIVAFAPLRWIPMLGSVMGISLMIGFFQNSDPDRLADLTPILGYLGLWIQTVGVIVVIVGGVMATMRNYQAASFAQ